MTVCRTDGQRMSMPLPPGLLDDERNIERFGWRAAEEILLIELPDGTTATIELNLGRPTAELRAGREIVYLDQNQWSKLSSWRHGRDIGEAEAEAAAALVGLVARRKVLVPASAGHFVETTPMYGVPRVELASTVLGVSRGWQMRSPLHVRLEELIRALRGDAPIATEPFVPGADAFFARLSRRTGSLPEPYATVNAELTRAMSIHATLIDPTRIDDPGGEAEAAAASWAKDHARIAQQLLEDGVSKEKAREVTCLRFLLDMSDDLARAGTSLQLSPEQAVTALREPKDAILEMPFLARFREVIHLRVRNAGQRWESNDLTDLMFLCCAAGYSNVVIAERATIAYLRQAERTMPAGAALATTLAEGVQALRTSAELKGNELLEA